MSKQETDKVMKQKSPYMIVDVTPFRDTRLSWKAKGLMTYFLDKPDGWTFILEHIYTQAPDGEKSVRSGLKELQKYGYIVRVAFRKKNKIDHFEFLVYEQPVAYPSSKPIHVDIEEWEKHLENGGTLDITLLAQNLQVGKLHVGNAGLINTNNNQSTKRINNLDDDGALASNILNSEDQENKEKVDPRYQLLNQFFEINGFDAAKKPEHQKKFLDALQEASFEKLMECATKYISLVREGKHEHKMAQVVWFLAGGWKNFLRQKPKPKRKANGQPLPRAIQEQIEEARQQATATMEEDLEEKKRLEEKRRRVEEKIRMMNQLSKINAP